MNKENIKTKRLYTKPCLQRVLLDKELSLAMLSQPAVEPEDPPGYLSIKLFKFLIR